MKIVVQNIVKRVFGLIVKRNIVMDIQVTVNMMVNMNTNMTIKRGEIAVSIGNIPMNIGLLTANTMNLVVSIGGNLMQTINIHLGIIGDNLMQTINIHLVIIADNLMQTINIHLRIISENVMMITKDMNPAEVFHMKEGSLPVQEKKETILTKTIVITKDMIPIEIIHRREENLHHQDKKEILLLNVIIPVTAPVTSPVSVNVTPAVVLKKRVMNYQIMSLTGRDIDMLSIVYSSQKMMPCRGKFCGLVQDCGISSGLTREIPLWQIWGLFQYYDTIVTGRSSPIFLGEMVVLV